MRRRIEFRKKLNVLFNEFKDLPYEDIASELGYYSLYFYLKVNIN